MTASAKFYLSSLYIIFIDTVEPKVRFIGQQRKQKPITVTIKNKAAAADAAEALNLTKPDLTKIKRVIIQDPQIPYVRGHWYDDKVRYQFIILHTSVFLVAFGLLSCSIGFFLLFEICLIEHFCYLVECKTPLWEPTSP